MQVILEPSGEELTIKLDQKETNLFSSLIEYFTRIKMDNEKITQDELKFANKLNKEFDYYSTNK